jgi:hypothetical protein
MNRVGEEQQVEFSPFGRQSYPLDEIEILRPASAPGTRHPLT